MKKDDIAKTGPADSRRARFSIPRGGAILNGERGATYVLLMCAIVVIGVSLTVVGKQWQVVMKREREAELLFRGHRIRAAIEAYAADYEIMKGTRSHRYPLRLAQLTQKPRPYLPIVYSDPITGEDFEPIKVGAEIVGVRSRSAESPLAIKAFKGAARYSQVTFQVDTTAVQPCRSDLHPLNRFNPLNPLDATSCRPPGVSFPAGPSVGGYVPADAGGSLATVDGTVPHG